jgi:hypothetical protein
MQSIFGILAISSVFVFVLGMINPKLFKNKKTGEMADRKTLAIGSVAIFVISLAMVGVLADDEKKDKPANNESSAPVSIDIPVKPAPLHHYVLKDGYEYGYEAALTENEKSNGRVAGQILMFKYSGSKGDTVQLFQTSDDLTMIVQCEFPCDFIKLITYSPHLGHINTERLRRADGMIASMAISDAIDEFLVQYVTERNGSKFNVWWDESGPKYTAVK